MDALEKYLHDHTSSEDPLLQELDRETHMREVAPRMLSGHLQGRLLELLVRMNRPHYVLEIGTILNNNMKAHNYLYSYSVLTYTK